VAKIRCESSQNNHKDCLENRFKITEFYLIPYPCEHRYLINIISEGRQRNVLIDEGTLNMISEGKVSICINGRPVVSLDGDSKSFEVEISGLKENDLKISNLIEARKSKKRLLLGTSALLRKMTKNGWSFSLYDKGEWLLTTGKPASKIGRHIHFNPLRLKRILDVL
jgi:hypothetical protein